MPGGGHEGKEEVVITGDALVKRCPTQQGRRGDGVEPEYGRMQVRLCPLCKISCVSCPHRAFTPPSRCVNQAWASFVSRVGSGATLDTVPVPAPPLCHRRRSFEATVLVSMVSRYARLGSSCWQFGFYLRGSAAWPTLSLNSCP